MSDNHTGQPREIILLSAASTALAQARTVDEIKHIRDKAAAAKQYAKSARLGLEIQNRAAEIKLRAERKAGEFLSQLPLRGGDRRSSGHVDRLKLADVGVSQNQSKRWQLVASLPEEQFESYLEAAKADSREITSSGPAKLAKQVRASTQTSRIDQVQPSSSTTAVSDLQQLIDSGETFSCIYADPPWPYDNKATRGAATDHYPTMELDDICDLPVSALARAKSHLHLWVTNAFLFDARQVLAACGFQYKTSFVWVKPQIAHGNYWRSGHELMLLALRGGLPFRDHAIKSWIHDDRSTHSRKPDLVRTLIERVSPGPYLELFARREIPGWVCFGNQIETALPPQADACKPQSRTTSSCPFKGLTPS